MSVPDRAETRFTERLRLEPVGPELAEDFWNLHQDSAIAEWYVDEVRWTHEDARRTAKAMAKQWERARIGKWLAYNRITGELVGRGGMSRMPLDSHQSRQIASLLQQPWTDDGFEVAPGRVLARRWLELGWALRGKFWGHGYATEIGRAALDLAFGDLEAAAVVAFSERHNARSLRVMERLGMQCAGELRTDGLVEGLEGVQENAPFAVYAVLRPVG